MSTDLDTPGGRIRQLRERKGLTQQQLAQTAGVSVGFLSEVEHNKRNPSGRVLLRVATALGSSTDYILQGAAPEPPPVRGPTPIPAELAEMAERERLSYRATVALANAYNQLVARRGGAADNAPTVAEWRDMYEALRRYLED